MNSFYYLLTRLPNINAQFPVSLNVSQLGENYAMILLPSEALGINIADETFALYHHHISIYENHYDLHPDRKYHYTALFHGNAQEYKLHVYFDEHDKLIAGPYFDAANGEAVELNREKSDFFARMAFERCMKPMICLRSQLKNTIISSEKTLNERIKNLLAMPANTLDTIDQRLQEYETLLPEAHHVQSLGGSTQTLQILSLYKNNIEWKKAELHTALRKILIKENHAIEAECSSAAKAECSSAVNPAIGIEEEIPATVTTKKDDSQAQRDEVMSQLRVLIATIDELESDKINPPEDSPQRALSYYESTNHAMGLHIDSAEDGSFGDIISKLHHSLTTSRELCIKLLLKALVFTDMASIELLKGMASFVPDQVLFRVIANGDRADILELLLKTNAFPVNQIVTELVEKAFGESLLQFALRKNSPRCFDVLLKHGASSLVTDSNELPLAHNVFMLCKGPFFQSLMEYHQSTGTLATIYSQLTSKLSTYLTENVLTDEQRKNILNAISHYRISPDRVLLSNAHQAMVARTNQTHVEALLSQHSTEELQKAQSSPAVIAKKVEHAFYEKFWLDNYASRADKITYSRAAREHTAYLAKLQEKGVDLGSSEAGFLAYVDREIDLLRKRIHIDALILQIKPYMSRPKLLKSIRPLVTEINQCIKEYNAIVHAENTEKESSDQWYASQSYSNSLFATVSPECFEDDEIEIIAEGSTAEEIQKHEMLKAFYARQKRLLFGNYLSASTNTEASCTSSSEATTSISHGGT